MTKKDFELIAGAFQEGRSGMNFPPDENTAPEIVLEYFAEIVADALATANAAFDRDRFLRACVPGANVRARS